MSLKSNQDIHRPTYHYVPAENWMNDPNGVIQWNGRYHLFYQYNPYGANHANMHWGHAVSDDMMTWEELPVAITPTPNSPDQGGIFSGCIIDNDGVPTAFYTGVNDDYSVQLQCSAIGSDDLVHWEKHPQNPVIDRVPETLGQTRDFRDPFVWREDDGWYMVVGSRVAGVGGIILLYRSDNLTDWTYLNPILVGETARTGVMYECPNFFKLGDKWVLIISSHIGHTTGTVLYFVGDFVDHRFIPEVEGVLDSGYYYAPLSHVDEQGRRLLWAWVREGRDKDQYIEAGWSGIQAVPRILELDETHHLIMKPVPELKTVQGTHHHFTGDMLSDASVNVAGQHLDIDAKFTVDADAPVGIKVLCSADESERVTIYYDPLTTTLRVERTYRGEATGKESFVQGLPHLLRSGESLQLRILVDGSIIEVIANERTSITTRFYSDDAQSQEVRVIHHSQLQTLDIWEMPS